uniref:Uncharacterized protein n=1 Tax=Strombidium inclinatum TaxID=197538 RepID=A0A7S3N441_9SPIT|mmetsp:Transcript_42415/g.65070  ORF Transcript_42415/g.65070 Transcript_42415/m.65070 type:complete len:102 (+) Transcript_42415:186-491(+)
MYNQEIIMIAETTEITETTVTIETTVSTGSREPGGRTSHSLHQKVAIEGTCQVMLMKVSNLKEVSRACSPVAELKATQFLKITLTCWLSTLALKSKSKVRS